MEAAEAEAESQGADLAEVTPAPPAELTPVNQVCPYIPHTSRTPLLRSIISLREAVPGGSPQLLSVVGCACFTSSCEYAG